MIKKAFIYVIIALFSCTICGCSVNNDYYNITEDENNNIQKDTQISRIEGYYATDSEKYFVLEDQNIIDDISNILKNLKKVDESDNRLSNIKEKYYIDFYKTSVTLVKSDDSKIYTIYFCSDSNIIKIRTNLQNMHLPYYVSDEMIDIYYEISDENMAYFDQLFNEKD